MNQTLTTQTPHQLHFRMPAEWETHQATWLAWPTDVKTWPDELREVEQAYVRMIEVLVGGEEVHILVRDEAHQVRVAETLRARDLTKKIFFHVIPTSSNWIRDFGPTFLIHEKQNKLGHCHWQCNAWGGKYRMEDVDRAVPRRVAELVGGRSFEQDMVLEGGSIDLNGEGTVLTTEQCLLNPNRNPSLNRESIESILKEFLGVRHVVWLSEGIVGDDTDGHVDTIARFVGPSTVLACEEQDSSDGNHRALKINRKRLDKATDQDGKRLQVIAVPMPGKVKYGASRFPASYANFYIGNKSVLVPTYNDPNDDIALNLIQDLFPKREVVGIPGVPLIYGRGAFHCATQTQPKISLK